MLHRPDVSTCKLILLQEIQKLPIDFSSSSGFFEPKDKKALAEFVALQTNGFSASKVIAVCTEACMICIRDIASLKNMDRIVLIKCCVNNCPVRNIRTLLLCTVLLFDDHANDGDNDHIAFLSRRKSQSSTQLLNCATLTNVLSLNQNRSESSEKLL